MIYSNYCARTVGVENMILKAIYIDEAEVGENSSSSNVSQNKDGLCNKEED